MEKLKGWKMGKRVNGTAPRLLHERSAGSRVGWERGGKSIVKASILQKSAHADDGNAVQLVDFTFQESRRKKIRLLFHVKLTSLKKTKET